MILREKYWSKPNCIKTRIHPIENFLERVSFLTPSEVCLSYGVTDLGLNSQAVKTSDWEKRIVSRFLEQKIQTTWKKPTGQSTTSAWDSFGAKIITEMPFISVLWNRWERHFAEESGRTGCTDPTKSQSFCHRTSASWDKPSVVEPKGQKVWHCLAVTQVLEPSGCTNYSYRIQVLLAENCLLASQPCKQQTMLKCEVLSKTEFMPQQDFWPLSGGWCTLLMCNCETEF